MTFDCNDQALRNYTKICRTEEREIFVLDGDFHIIFSNEPAIQRYNELTPDYFIGLFSKDKDELESIMNHERYYVDEQLVDGRIALLYRMDIPSELQYYELTLWEKQPAVQSKAQSIEKLSSYANALANNDGCPQQLISLFEREVFLFAANQRLLNGLHGNTQAGIKCTVFNFFTKVGKIAAMRGVNFEYSGFYFIIPLDIPVSLAYVFIYTFAALLNQSLPGDTIKASADAEDKYSLKIELVRHTLPAKLEGISGLDIAVVRQLSEYLNGTMEIKEDEKRAAVCIEIPLSQFPADSQNKDHFYVVPDLLNAVSTCVNRDKIRPYTLSSDLSLNWAVFPQEIYHNGTVSACIQSIHDRLNSVDYRDLYGNQIYFNLTVMTDFNHYLYINQARLSGIGKTKALYDNPQSIPIENYKKIASVYGLKVENLSAPNFILNIMAGRNLTDEKMACDDRSGAALLVFDQLQSDCSDFQTDNRTFNVCQQAVDSDADDISLWFDRGMESIRQGYFDQSIPINVKIGNNLTILRLANRLTLEEAAVRADINLQKLKALETGDITHAYCRDLDRLCRIYQVETPPGLFINGYALIVLWRRSFMCYGVPPTLYNRHPSIVHDLKHWHDDSIQIYEKREHAERDYSSFLESSLPVVFLDENQTPIRRNAAARKMHIAVKKKGDPLLDIFHSRIILWVAGKEIILSPGDPAFPQIYLFEVNRFGQFRLTMAIYDLDGTVNPAEIAKSAGLT